jgi:ABC-type transport system substrate-binding protein
MREDNPGQPVCGGTLEMVGLSDIDHLTTTSAYNPPVLGLLRAFTRTLVAYKSSSEFTTAIRLVPDLATELPSKENGEISADGLTYTFHLRRGVRWDTTPPREVTAHDFVRAFRLFCNPVSPVGAPGYYTSTIADLEGYCARFARVPGNIESIREFVNTQEFSGVHATDDYTIEFHLLKPSPDFLNLVALWFASPVPEEYLDYLPDSPEFRQHTLSNGPYQITRYVPNHEMHLDRNPVWDPTTDPIRRAYIDHIRIRFGIDAQLQQLQIAAGTADLSFDETIPTAELSFLMAAKDPTVGLPPPGDTSAGFVYLVINRVGPKGHSIMGDLKVRRALGLAVDRAALVQLAGGPRVARALRQAVPSCASGHRKGAENIPNGERGNSTEARALLAAARYPSGISLRLVYPIFSSYPLQAQALQASLARANVNVELVPQRLDDFYSRLLTNMENAVRGEWDLALAAWFPDWYGDNNGRSVIQPLFDGRFFGKAIINYGGYRNPDVDALIDRAMTAGSSASAEQIWKEAARLLTEDVAVVPLLEVKSAFARSRRLRNCTWGVPSSNCDITSVWLADAAQKRGSPQ